jgi:hypothetical protein
MAIAFVTGSNSQTVVSTAANSQQVTYPAALLVGQESVIIVSLRTTTATVSTITDSKSNTYAFRQAINNGAVTRVELWSSKLTTAVAITDTFTVTLAVSTTSKMVICTGCYSGVAARGATGTNTNSTANPTISLTTQDNNNFVVAGFAAQGTGLPGSLTGAFEGSAGTTGGAAATNVSGAMTDNTATTPTSVTNAVNLVAESWAAVVLELRTVASAFVAEDDSYRVNLQIPFDPSIMVW